MAALDLTIVSEARPRRPRPYVLLRPGPAAAPLSCACVSRGARGYTLQAPMSGALAAPAAPFPCPNGDVGHRFGERL
jgi:hypothetical protein